MPQDATPPLPPVIADAAAPAAAPPSRRLPLIVACGLFMEGLDGTVLSTSLPAIARSLNEDPIALKLALTAYLISLAVFIPISGWAADRFGTRRVFMAAICVFLAGSALCGLASTLPQFVGARIVQGMGGAMMVPVGRLILLRAIPKAELVSAMAWMTVPALMGPVTGPLVGGFITTTLDWRWIFYVNIPVGLLGLYLVRRHVPNWRADVCEPLDIRGAALSGLGLAAAVLGFALIGQNGAPLPVALGVAGLGALALALYVRHARRHPRPVLDLTLLRLPTFRAGIFGASLFRIGVGAMPFLVPLLLQLGFGLSPLESGSITFAAALGAIAMKLAAPPILRRFGFRRVLLANGLVAAAFMAAFAWVGPTTPALAITTLLLAGGFFRSLQFTAVNAIAIADVPTEKMSRATSFTSVAQQVSLSLGVAIGALVLQGARAARGGEAGTALLPADFAAAFLIIGALSALSLFSFLRLPRNAGAELSGHAMTKPARPLDPRGEIAPH